MLNHFVVADVRGPEVFVGGAVVVIAAIALVVGLVIGGLMLTRHFRTKKNESLNPPNERK